MSVVLSVQGLSLGYPGVSLFRQLSLDVVSGTTLAVLGANGTGKTTFVKALLGLLTPLAGRLQWPQGCPQQIGYLAQTSEFDRRFPIRVRDLVAMGGWRGFGFWSGPGRAGRAGVGAALHEAGIQGLADHPIHTLSGGQLQRALFARVMVQNAPLILLDEPFNGVDQNTEAHLQSIIDGWRREGRTVIMVVHDLSTVLDHCDSALLLGAGGAIHGAVKDVVVPEHLIARGYLSESQAGWIFRQRLPVPVHGRG